MTFQFRISSNNWIFSLQVLCISIAVLSLAFFLNLSLPVILDFLVTEVPLLWNSMNYWLTPPYLYIVIHFIIITIAASSRFQNKIEYQMETVVPVLKNHDDSNPDFIVSAHEDDDDVVILKRNPEFESVISTDYDAVNLVMMKKEVNSVPDLEESSPFNKDVYVQSTEGGSEELKKNLISATDHEDDFVDSWLNQRDSTEIPSVYPFSEEKRPVSARFGHRKTVKVSSNEAGKGLRSVAKPKRQDTLESTWKTITEGRSMPLARHLKKSDTLEMHNSGPHVSSSSSSSITMAHNVNQSSSPSPSRGSVRLRKEPSLSQDELNRRVEAFITKFNEEMRLQRQESLNQYNEMVSRGALLY